MSLKFDWGSARSPIDEAAIQQELERTEAALSTPTRVYVLGGSAVSLRGSDSETSDIDLLAPDNDAYTDIMMGMSEYCEEVRTRSPDYRALELTSSRPENPLEAPLCLETDDGRRYNLFQGKVPQRLELTDGVRERATHFETPGPLTVELVSDEDAFLFAMTAGRDCDVETLHTLAGRDLNYDTVETELAAQLDRLGDDHLVLDAEETLRALEKRYGVTTPVHEHVTRLAARYRRGRETLHTVGASTSLNGLTSELECTESEAADSVAYLKRFDRLRQSDETITSPLGESLSALGRGGSASPGTPEHETAARRVSEVDPRLVAPAVQTLIEALDRTLDSHNIAPTAQQSIGNREVYVKNARESLARKIGELAQVGSARPAVLAATKRWLRDGDYDAFLTGLTVTEWLALELPTAAVGALTGIAEALKPALQFEHEGLREVFQSEFDAVGVDPAIQKDMSPLSGRFIRAEAHNALRQAVTRVTEAPIDRIAFTDDPVVADEACTCLVRIASFDHGNPRSAQGFFQVLQANPDVVARNTHNLEDVLNHPFEPFCSPEAFEELLTQTGADSVGELINRVEFSSTTIVRGLDVLAQRHPKFVARHVTGIARLVKYEKEPAVVTEALGVLVTLSSEYPSQVAGVLETLIKTLRETDDRRVETAIMTILDRVAETRPGPIRDRASEIDAAMQTVDSNAVPDDGVNTLRETIEPGPGADGTTGGTEDGREASTNLGIWEDRLTDTLVGDTSVDVTTALETVARARARSLEVRVDFVRTRDETRPYDLTVGDGYRFLQVLTEMLAGESGVPKMDDSGPLPTVDMPAEYDTESLVAVALHKLTETAWREPESFRQENDLSEAFEPRLFIVEEVLNGFDGLRARAPAVAVMYPLTGARSVLDGPTPEELVPDGDNTTAQFLSGMQRTLEAVAEGEPDAATTLKSLLQNVSPVEDADTAFAVSYLLNLLARECPHVAAAHASELPGYVGTFDAPTTANALEALSWLSRTDPDVVINTLEPTLEALRDNEQFEAGHLAAFLLRGTELAPFERSKSTAKVVLALSETAPEALAPVADELVSYVALIGNPEHDETAAVVGDLLAAVAAVPAEAHSGSAALKSDEILEVGEATGQREAAIEIAGTLQTADLPGLSANYEQLVETTARASDPAVAARGLRHIMTIGANEPHGFRRSVDGGQQVVELLGELVWRFDYAEPMITALLCNYDSQPEVTPGVVDILVASVSEGGGSQELGPHRHRIVESILVDVLDGQGPSAAAGVGMDFLGRLGSTVPEAE